MSVDFRKLANQSVRDLVPYEPGKPVETLERELGIRDSIKLASNENPLGPSPLALASIKDALNHAHIYPDGDGFEIKNKLSHFLGVHPNQITLGNGSENILELIVKAYLEKNDSAVISQYAFLTIPIILKSYGITVKTAPAFFWKHHIEAMLQMIDEKTRVLFLVNPNNPTGTYNHADDFDRLMAHVPEHVLVVVDEAYKEYITQADYPNTLQLLSRYPNLIITRTFSKIYGLAGLRLGYGVSSDHIADILNRARLPFNVNSIVSKAACAALDDHEHLRKTMALNNQGKMQMLEAFKSWNMESIPSITNFLTLKVDSAKHVYRQLLQQGVIIRPLNAYDMPHYIRITIGTYEQNERFLRALKNII